MDQRSAGGGTGSLADQTRSAQASSRRRAWPTYAREWVLRRDRDFGLAQSLARQRHQGLRRRRLQALRRVGARHRGRHLRPHRTVGGGRLQDRRLGLRACCPATRSCAQQYAEWLASLVGPGSFGKLRVLVDCANGAASSDGSAGLSRTAISTPTSCTSSPTAATSMPVAERCIPSTWRRRWRSRTASTISASPSTATPTAPCSPTPRATW